MALISARDRERFLDRGYLVVPGVVDAGLCRDVTGAICEFIGVDLDEPDTWYRRPTHGHGIVPLHHDPRLWRVRILPSVYAVFRALYEREDLWVTMDRVSFKPRAREPEAYRLSPVHWDCDPRSFHDLGVQGLVYLTDTDPDQGAFACVPELYRELPAWVAEHGDDANLRHPDIGGRALEHVGGPAGSLVLWHRLMPHTSGRNDSPLPRFTQYVAMAPAGGEAERARRIRAFQERHAPEWALRQHVPGQLDPEPCKPIPLTSLGRRLVGLDPW